MSSENDDPRCPECDEPIGQTATYCMHCSADLEEREIGDADEDGGWDLEEAASNLTEAAANQDASAASDVSRAEKREAVTDAIEETVSTGRDDEQLLDPEGFIDDTLTVVVGIAGGIVVGVVGTTVLGIVTGSGWAILFGVLAWLGSTAYLVRRRTVQEAVSKASYAAALVLLFVPVIALSPAAEIESGGRGGLFVVLLVFVAVPAGVAAVVGWIASRFVPEEESGGTA